MERDFLGSRRVLQRHHQYVTLREYKRNTMADYKTYLAASILTEDKVVRSFDDRAKHPADLTRSHIVFLVEFSKYMSTQPNSTLQTAAHSRMLIYVGCSMIFIASRTQRNLDQYMQPTSSAEPNEEKPNLEMAQRMEKMNTCRVVPSLAAQYHGQMKVQGKAVC